MTKIARLAAIERRRFVFQLYPAHKYMRRKFSFLSVQETDPVIAIWPYNACDAISVGNSIISWRRGYEALPKTPAAAIRRLGYQIVITDLQHLGPWSTQQMRALARSMQRKQAGIGR